MRRKQKRPFRFGRSAVGQHPLESPAQRAAGRTGNSAGRRSQVFSPRHAVRPVLFPARDRRSNRWAVDATTAGIAARPGRNRDRHQHAAIRAPTSLGRQTSVWPAFGFCPLGRLSTKKLSGADQRRFRDCAVRSGGPIGHDRHSPSPHVAAAASHLGRFCRRGDRCPDDRAGATARLDRSIAIGPVDRTLWRGGIGRLGRRLSQPTSPDHDRLSHRRCGKPDCTGPVALGRRRSLARRPRSGPWHGQPTGRGLANAGLARVGLVSGPLGVQSVFRHGITRSRQTPPGILRTVLRRNDYLERSGVDGRHDVLRRRAQPDQKFSFPAPLGHRAGNRQHDRLLGSPRRDDGSHDECRRRLRHRGGHPRAVRSGCPGLPLVRCWNGLRRANVAVEPRHVRLGLAGGHLLRPLARTVG